MSDNNFSILKGKSLLFVDDEPATRNAIRRMMQHRFGEVWFAENGEMGLEILEKHQPDIVITDIEMPVMNGLMMLEKIKEKHPKVPVIIMTAFEDEAHKAENADSILIKPVDKMELLELLAGYCGEG